MKGLGLISLVFCLIACKSTIKTLGLQNSKWQMFKTHLGTNNCKTRLEFFEDNHLHIVIDTFAFDALYDKSTQRIYIPLDVKLDYAFSTFSSKTVKRGQRFEKSNDLKLNNLVRQDSTFRRSCSYYLIEMSGSIVAINSGKDTLELVNYHSNYQFNR